MFWVAGKDNYYCSR